MKKKARLKIHINEDCNQRCVNCYSQKYHYELSLSKVQNIIKQGADMEIGKLDILGGEPLLRNDLLEIVGYAQSMGLETTLFTNATLISNSLARSLKDSGLERVIVTLHSHEEKLHDKMTMTPNSWRRAINGMREFINVGIKTYTNTAVNSLNLNYVQNINCFAKQMGAKALFQRNIPKSYSDKLIIKDKNKWQDFVAWLFYQKSEKCAAFLLKDLKKAREKGYTCPAFYNMLSIKADGDVTVCPFSNFSLGNIYTSSLSAMVEESSKCDSHINSIFFGIPDKCQGCSISAVCRGGCKAYTHAVMGSYSEKDPLCRGPWKEEIKFDDIGKYITYH